MRNNQFTTKDGIDLTALFSSGEIAKLSKDELERYAVMLSMPNVSGHFSPAQFSQVCETIRMLMLRAHIKTLQNQVVELHNHITSLNKKNSVTQYCVIALTVASLIGTVAQVWYAKKADQRSPLEIQQTVSTPEPKITKDKNGTGVNPTQLKLVPKSHQTTPNKDVSQ